MNNYKREGTMLHHRIGIIMIVVILSLAWFVPLAQAQRQDFESRQCAAQTFNVAHFSSEIAIFSNDTKGIIQSTHESKLFDNWTFHLVGVHKGVDGSKWTWNGFMKEMGPDGEFIIWEYYGGNESGTMAKPIYGSGKWKGVKGERKSTVITAGKPIVQGSAQVCQKQVGWIELAK
jgi:hypothetical protein